MLTKDDAHRFAQRWIAAWNAHDPITTPRWS